MKNKAACGDSIFNSRRRDGAFRPGAADGVFMRAEACRNAGSPERMAALLRAYLRLKPERPEAAAALELTGRCSEGLALAARHLRSGRLTPEETSLLANPWINISNPGFIRRSLRALSGARAPAGAGALKALQLFVLRSAAGLPAGEPPLLRGRLSIANVHAARALLEAGRESPAARLLAETVKNFPNDEYACGKLAEALLCGGLEKEALTFLAGKAAAIRSPGFAAWRGQLLLAAGRQGEAAAVLASPPAALSPMSGCWLGAALLRIGSGEAALELLRPAARSGEPEAALWLAEALRQEGKNEAALRAAETALAPDHTHPWALLTAGLLCLETGRARRGRRLLAAFAAGKGRALNPPARVDAAWAARALGSSSCRRPELHFLRLAGRRLAAGRAG